MLHDYKRIDCKKPLPYFYLLLNLEFEDKNKSVDAIFFKKSITMAMKELFGEVGATVSVDVLKYTDETKTAILRVDSGNYIKLRSALMLYGQFLESKDICAFMVQQVSQHLMALSVNSRIY